MYNNQDIKNILQNKTNEIKKIHFGKFSRNDITGKIFNHLYVLGKDGEKSDNIYCLCLNCKEHNIVSKNKSNVVLGKTKSCGCIRKETAKKHIVQINHDRRLDLTNQIFGNLKVIKMSNIKKGSHIYWDCKCLQCNSTELYPVRTDQLTSGLTTCCNKCNNQISMGESKIISLLISNNIKYVTEKRFDDCRFPDTDSQAKFDFYIPDNQYLIEFDGKQHFEDLSNCTKFATLSYIKEHDKYKNQWCKDNNIPLIRIPYWHLKDLCIEDLLLETSKYAIGDENNDK